MDWEILFFGSVAILIQYFAEEYRKEDLAKILPSDTTDYLLPQVETYDFIVVGGGSAGCVVSARLSENPNIRILVLEAGGNLPPQTEVPAFAPKSREAPSIVFNYKSVPQAYVNKNIIPAQVGKILGGTSTINYMFYNRGSPYDYDNWANITNDLSWGYGEILDYFKKSEDYKGQFGPGIHHGTDGPIPVTSQGFAPGLFNWAEAGREKGFHFRDPNGPQYISFGPIEYNKVEGRRVNAYSAFLREAEASRSNLDVIRYAEVTQVLLDRSNKAYGVTFRHHGVYRGAMATKEVILSAGTYGSPQILMRSGIGPAELLEQAKITPRVDLPVGRNLQDHPKVPLKISVQDKSVLFDPKENLNQNTVKDFLARGLGPLTSTGAATGQAYLASTVAREEGHPEWSDIQLVLYSQSQGIHGNASTDEQAIFIYPYATRPKSRGWIVLDQDDINRPPIIDFNFFHDRRDIEVLVDAIKTTLEIIENTKVYRWVGASYTREPLPTCRHHIFRTDPYWDCYIRTMATGGNNPAGTCPMGHAERDPHAVVDTRLRVLGVKSLRVVDASVMPVIVNTDLQATVYMIAEKASDHIKRFWRL